MAHLVFNDLKRLNPMDVPMLDDILSALEVCDQDKGVNVLVISGEGSAFSAGGGIRSMINEFDTLPALARKLGEAALEYQVSLFDTEDFKEGITAFAEKRKPNF